MAFISAAIIGGAAIAAGAATAYGSYRGAQAQAGAARDAARSGAAAAMYAADRNAEAAERSAQIQADAMLRAGQMQRDVQRQMMDMQREIMNRQLMQAERLSVREELRYVTGKAATDTFNKVAGTATTLWEINDVNREQRLIEQFGLGDNPELQAPPVAPSSWEASNYDLLTGERVSDSNPYALEGDLMNELEREEEGFDNDIGRIISNEEGPEVPDFAEDIIGDARGRTGDPER